MAGYWRIEFPCPHELFCQYSQPELWQVLTHYDVYEFLFLAVALFLLGHAFVLRVLDRNMPLIAAFAFAVVVEGGGGLLAGYGSMLLATTFQGLLLSDTPHYDVQMVFGRQLEAIGAQCMCVAGMLSGLITGVSVARSHEKKSS